MHPSLFHSSSPEHCCGYCDIQKNKSPQCMEMDIIEANGNCAMQVTTPVTPPPLTHTHTHTHTLHTHAHTHSPPTPPQSTWHTDPDHGGGCDEGGCAAQERLPGAAIHMRAAFGRDGAMTVFLDGKVGVCVCERERARARGSECVREREGVGIVVF